MLLVAGSGSGCLEPQQPSVLPPGTLALAASHPQPNRSSAANSTVHTVSHSEPEPLPVSRQTGPLAADTPAPPTDAPSLAGSPRSVGGLLALDEVLLAVERHHPLLRAVEQERALAGGRLVSAMGAFDLSLNAGTDGQGTTYQNLRTNVGASQLLPAGGVSVFGGYRTGFGDFATYNLGQKTADGGEFRAGMTIPLLRDRAIDRPRAAVQQAKLDVALAEPLIERQRLDFHRAAARTYWNWVAAGQRLKVVEELLKLAVERDAQLKARVEADATANIERVDNQQNIARRNAVLVQAQRGFQQATIDLSLFLRDDAGTPTLAGLDRLPDFPQVESVAATSFDAALRTAFAERPEPQRLRLQLEKAGVDRQLATNQTLPNLNATLSAAQEVGAGKSSLSGPNGLDRTNLAAGVSFQLPVQRREALGRVMTTNAQIVQLAQQLRQAEDVIRADVQDTFSALERAYAFYQEAKKATVLARQVAAAERLRLELKNSDVLRVTLREQTVFEAEVIEIGARQDYFRALADFRAAQGLGGK